MSSSSVVVVPSSYAAFVAPVGHHPLAAFHHNGSIVDVAVLIDGCSQIAAHLALLSILVTLVAIPLILAGEGPAMCAACKRYAAGLVLVARLIAAELGPPTEEGEAHPNRTEHGRGSPARLPSTTTTTDHGVHHMAVIMDGNRRWGKSNRGSGLQGHEEGANSLLRFIRWSTARKVRMLTVYAFSTENWSRPAVEVAMLMGLFRSFFSTIRAEAQSNGIRIRFLVSEAERLPADVLELMRAVEVETRTNDIIVVNVCVSYSGRAGLLKAARELHDARVEPTADTMRRELCRSLTDDRPAPLTAANLSVQLADGTVMDLAQDPQVLLRTSREQRLSNFMLYELAYAELFFVDELWPSVTEQTLENVLVQFSGRSRRFGA